MATCKIPEFTPVSGTVDARVYALERALSVLTRELGYVLTHLDEANFTPEERELFVTDMEKRIKEAVDYGTAT
jgi:hypothetical protein